MTSAEVVESQGIWIYFSARRWGDFRPERGRRADGPPAGSPIREPAGDREWRLLALERGAVHVAGLAIGLAAEAQDGGVVDETVGDGHGLSGRREKLSPLPEGQVRNDSVESGMAANARSAVQPRGGSLSALGLNLRD